MADRVVPLKLESSTLGGTQTDTFPVPATVNEDGLEARSYYLQNDTSRDSSVFITRDSSNNLILHDAVLGVDKTLSSLVPPTTASQIANVPAGNLISTNVQSALNELQSKIDTINATPGIDGYVADAGGVTLYQMLRLSTSGTVTAAVATDYTKADVIGSAATSQAEGTNVRVLINGSVVSPVKEGVETWTARDAIYLSASVPGAVTKTPPVGINKVLLRVGYAKTNTTMTLNIGEPVILAQ